jgi:hypothetical protein
MAHENSHRCGRVVKMEDILARRAEALRRHGRHALNLPVTGLTQFDCKVAFGNVLPYDDQGQCGDCFGVSSADLCSMALIKAGLLPLDTTKGRLSSQYGLDNRQAFQGGCNGGDEGQVIDFIKTTGFPLTSDYGPYQASPGYLKPISGMQIYKVADYGACDPSKPNGIADYQLMKNCMVQYGPLSVALDASCLNNYSSISTVIKGSGGNVDHAIGSDAFDDSKGSLSVAVNPDGGKQIRGLTAGALRGYNQWGQWGDPSDYNHFWIEAGAYSFGTEAMWIDGGAPNIPPQPWTWGQREAEGPSRTMFLPGGVTININLCGCGKCR